LGHDQLAASLPMPGGPRVLGERAADEVKL